MATSDILKRYLDAGLAFTQLTRDRADAIVKELVRLGEVQREKAEERVEQLLERSRLNREELTEMIRREVAEQLRALGLDDVTTAPGAPAREAPRGPGAAGQPDELSAEAARKTALGETASVPSGDFDDAAGPDTGSAGASNADESTAGSSPPPAEERAGVSPSGGSSSGAPSSPESDAASAPEDEQA